jgi:biopolymer transport protein ExbD
MGASTSSGDEGVFAGINVTPLVDITLVLLIIFMVTAKLIVSQTMPMDLPKSATSNEQQIVFAVSLNKDGSASIDSRKIENDQAVLDLAKTAHQKESGLRAVIAADATVPHGRVVHVMDLLKQAGIGKIAFGVTPVTSEGSAKQ